MSEFNPEEIEKLLGIGNPQPAINRRNARIRHLRANLADYQEQIELARRPGAWLSGLTVEQFIADYQALVERDTAELATLEREA